VFTAVSAKLPADANLKLAAASTAAADLNTIDTATSAVVDATAVTEITGIAATLATAIGSAGIDTAAGVDATVSAGVAAAADLNTIDTATSAVVDATAVTEITGSAADFATLITAKDADPATITLAAHFSATVTGAFTMAGFDAIDAATTGAVSPTRDEATDFAD
jgi:hypothetical protein